MTGVVNIDLSAGPVIKICGLKRPEDVRLAARLGAWAVGFILAPSPRQVTPEEVRELAREARAAPRPGALPAPLVVGVFGDATVEEVVAVARLAGLDAVQLHGRRSPGAELVKAAAAARSGSVRADTDGGNAQALLVIQAVPVPSSGVDEALLVQQTARALRSGADVVLFDTSLGAQFGGSGCPFSWEAVAEVCRAGLGEPRGVSPVIIAGGIRPDNVGEALERSGAWGVDVSSGIEVTPGEKDPRLMECLFEEARAAWLRRQDVASG